MALHYWMGDVHHCSGPPVCKMTYTVSSGTLNSTIPYHRCVTCKDRQTNDVIRAVLLIFTYYGMWSQWNCSGMDTLTGCLPTHGLTSCWAGTRTLPHFLVIDKNRVLDGRQCDVNTVKVKVRVKVHTLDIAPLRSESSLQKHSGMARVFMGFHSFTCTPTRSSAIRMSHTCLCLPSRSWYSFTDPRGMEGWIDLGAK